MFNVSHQVLKILAAIVWYIGSGILLLKGGSLIFEAENLEPNRGYPWLSAFSGIFLGVIKTRYLFIGSCRKNIDRIHALSIPKVWQFYSPWFFVRLTAMIMLGTSLSRMAHGNYSFLLWVGLLDISIGIALLGSSYVFWKEKYYAVESA